MATAKKTASGNWRVQVFVGNTEEGKKKKKSFTAPTKREAERLAMEYVLEMQSVAASEQSRYVARQSYAETSVSTEGVKSCQSVTRPSRITVGQALRDYINLKRNVLSPATIRGYENIVKNRLQSVMDIDMHELDSIAMQRAINEDAAKMGMKSIRESRNLVVTALKMYGVRPDLNVTLPAKEPKIKDLPTAEQVIKMIRGTDIELPCMLALWLSLRISEVRGLQFRDLKDGVLTIRRSRLYLGGEDVLRGVNKTYNSTRRLTLPAYLIELIEAVPHESEEDFIVPMNYQFIRKHLQRLAEKNGYTLTFHDLRHLNASVMLMLGIPDKYAMERGGWSTPNTLKAVYQHTFSEERKLVDKQIDEFFENIIEG